MCSQVRNQKCLLLLQNIFLGGVESILFVFVFFKFQIGYSTLKYKKWFNFLLLHIWAEAGVLTPQFRKSQLSKSDVQWKEPAQVPGL